MKRFKHLVIGGIQNKVFNLILAAVILMTAAGMGISVFYNQVLSQVVTESGEKQEKAITEITSSVMEQVVVQSLSRTNRTDAQIADTLFRTFRERVTFLGECAGKLLVHPEAYVAKPYAAPDPADDGTWKAKVIYAEGVQEDDPALVEKLGLLSNLSEMMVTMCPALGAANAYIALPEGAHLSVSDTSSSWFEDGNLRSYDPRTRIWYQQAVEAGKLIFTEGEWDANTGEYCVECAMPVYGPDGTLQAVVGMDCYLKEMQDMLQETTLTGEYQLMVNQNGHAVFLPLAEAFPMEPGDAQGDLREAKTELLAQIVRETLQGGAADGVRQGQLADGGYYIASNRIPTTGWVLLTAFSQETADIPTQMLQESNLRIQAEGVEAYQRESGKVRLQAIFVFLAVMAVTIGGAIVLGRRIVRPLNTITERISSMKEGNLEFRMEDTYRTGDEVEELAQSFATLSHKTMEYVETVRRVTTEKERIGAELSLATQIQASMLPHIVPAFPDRKEFDIFGSMDPAKEVGGDFYDYFLIDDDHLGMVIADVSGKGVPAALFMMASKIILQSIAMGGASPAEILERTNKAICSNNEAEMFVTVWLGILEISTGRLKAANAGHEYPVVKHPDGRYELYKDKHGFVIGGMDGVKYREYEILLQPGSKVFVYTDGVPEATNAEKELFGTDRMLEALNAAPADTPQEVLKLVRSAVDRFVLDAEQFDDLTMLCLDYKQREGESR